MTKDKKTLRVLQLYPRDMNIYGDWGNTLTLKRRIQWHGYNVEVIDYNPEDAFPDDIDIVVGGGGQDSGQSKIQNDLLAIGSRLKSMADDDVPMLMICGLYQLFGHFFRTKDGDDIKGIGVLDIETRASNTRLIGNIVTMSDEFGEIVGYENHSGLTTLASNVQPFGSVIKGAGNNGRDNNEGARYRNVIGSYMHGSLLPKNPLVADWLIEKACFRSFGDYKPTVIEDRFAEKARAIALKRPR